MNVLIDTHILIWALFSPDKLKESQKEILLDNSNVIFVSAVSLWEISLKYSVGKLKISKKQLDKIIPAIETSGFELVDLDSDEAMSFYKLPKLKNEDPFDRMLVWQCIYNDYNLMSSDESIGDYGKNGLKTV